MPERFADAAAVMRRAIELAARGEGTVEPNPLVGAVLVDDGLQLIAEGFHQQWGGAHAEVEAIRAAGARAAGATLFVTLEPCCHYGKTGPCTEAIIAAGIRKVFTAMRDPFSAVDGKGVAALRALGIDVQEGLHAEEARRLNAPFIKRVTTGRPWVHAKWAMSLDGKIATRTGESRWISSEASRAVVHRLRGRVDAVLIGAGTALSDDPLLTARPPGPRVATRIVVDSRARLPISSQLVRTAAEFPLMIATSSNAAVENVRALQSQGIEVLQLPSTRSVRPETGAAATDRVDLDALLTELGRRDFTNVLVEGGAALLGSFFDAGLVDEAHVFVAPKVIGGAGALTAVGGEGRAAIELADRFPDVVIRAIGDDVYINARRRPLP